MSELTERERAGGTGSAGAGSDGGGDDDVRTAVGTVDAPPRPDDEVSARDVDTTGPIDADGATPAAPWYARAGRRRVDAQPDGGQEGIRLGVEDLDSFASPDRTLDADHRM